MGIAVLNKKIGGKKRCVAGKIRKEKLCLSHNFIISIAHTRTGTSLLFLSFVLSFSY